MRSAEVVIVDQEKWNHSIALYNKAIHRNVIDRVGRMSIEDINRYNDLHNTPNASREDVLRHIIESENFDADAQIHKTDSSSFNLMNAEPKIYGHIPPKSFGQPWIELIDDSNGDEQFECFVKVFGLGRRKRDIENKTFLFEINECLWECCGGTEAGMQLLSLDQQWKQADTHARAELWPTINNLLAKNISFSMRYSTWENPFFLRLTPFASNNEQPMPTSDSVFGFTRFENGFPYCWKFSQVPY